MSNPYEDYDAIDPWEDDPSADDSGDFSFVEDEYDSLGAGEDDTFSPYPDGQYDMSATRKGSTEALPKTMVRQQFDIPAQDEVAPPSGGVLKRKRGRGRRVGDRGQSHVDPGSYDQRWDDIADVRQPQPVQPTRAERRRPRRRRHHGCLITLLLMIAAVVGIYWVIAHPIDEQLAFSPQEQQTLDGSLSWYVPGTPYYLLALGSDAREGEEYSRTDTMVLMRVDLVGAKLTLVSIPRDTKVEIEGYGTSKINSAYTYGGVGGAARAVSRLTGVPVNHVAVIHFEELVGLIDYLGGVTLNVPEGVSDPYTGITVDSGLQTMDGITALLWARSRYGYENGDFQRQEDQRILITAIMNRMLSLSPKEMPGAFKQLSGLIGTDMRCYNLVPLFVRFRLGSPVVYSCTLPTTSAYLDGQWYEVADDAEVAQLMRVVGAGGDPSA